MPKSSITVAELVTVAVRLIAANRRQMKNGEISKQTFVDTTTGICCVVSALTDQIGPRESIRLTETLMALSEIDPHANTTD